MNTIASVHAESLRLGTNRVTQLRIDGSSDQVMRHLEGNEAYLKISGLRNRKGSLPKAAFLGTQASCPLASGATSSRRLCVACGPNCDLTPAIAIGLSCSAVLSEPKGSG